MPTRGSSDKRDANRDAVRLAHEAAAQLRLVDPHATLSANRAHAVEAAIILDEVLGLLRSGLSGKTVILTLLRDASPEPVSSSVLRHSSGIQEFARRIRELRDDGYDIRSTGSGYRLVLSEVCDPQDRTTRGQHGVPHVPLVEQDTVKSELT